MRLGSKLGQAAGADGKIKVSPDSLYAEEQVRKDFSEEEIQELAESIQSEGQLQPVTVAQRDRAGKYLIIYGERRWRACKLLGQDVWIVEEKRKRDPGATLLVQLIENVQRSDLSLIEQAESVASLVRDHNMTQAEIASRMGKPKPHISKLVTIGDMPAVVHALYSDGTCRNLDTLAALTRLYDIAPDACTEFCQQARSTGYAKRSDAEQLLRLKKTPASEKRSGTNSPDNATTKNGASEEEKDNLSEESPTNQSNQNLNVKTTTSSQTDSKDESGDEAWIAKDPRDLTVRCVVDTSDGVKAGKVELDKLDSDESYCWVSFDDAAGQPTRVACTAVRLTGFI